MHSPELDIRGTGTIDLFTQQYDLKVNMLTQAGQNISKIPLVGYIMAGDEEHPSLTFHVTGDLLDPTVESTAFQEVLTQPFEMVFRTIATPFKWAKDIVEEDQDDDPPPAEDLPDTQK